MSTWVVLLLQCVAILANDGLRIHHTGKSMINFINGNTLNTYPLEFELFEETVKSHVHNFF